MTRDGKFCRCSDPEINIYYLEIFTDIIYRQSEDVSFVNCKNINRLSVFVSFSLLRRATWLLTRLGTQRFDFFEMILLVLLLCMFKQEYLLSSEINIYIKSNFDCFQPQLDLSKSIMKVSLSH